jgi:hypothetical protein
MGAHRSSFGKLERDRAKKAKAAAKRERRQGRGEADAPEDEGSGPVVAVADELSAGDLLKMVESIHQQFEAKLISYEDYEERKADLLSRLSVD